MHLHNPGICAVGGDRTVCSHWKCPGSLHFRTPAPQKNPKASQEMPHLLSALVHAKDSGILQLSGMLLAQVPDPGCISHPHQQDSDFPARSVYPGNSPKMKNELCSPHSKLIEAAKSNTQRKEKKSFRASVSILSCSVCTDWSTAIALLIPQQGWTSKQSKTASFTAVGETLMDEGKPERRDNFVGKRIWILSWKMDSTQWFPLSKSNLLKPNLFQVITNSVAPLQGHKTISVLIWGTARHWQR